MDQTPQTTLSPKTPDARPARAGEALSIRRVFTQSGVHPFDTIEWDLRDARISTVFEQTDVEFPTTWSQNATNIVAQKYFRGQLGSPTRERSVKQMISRVAGTIADWGRERGYFATPEDGDSFEAELTYILLNQMAAFNSPVWFNVGFEESPQCSACMPYDQLVSTPEGMVPIGELVDEDAIGREVYDASGVTRIVATKYNGRKDVFRITLRNGQSIEATADHVVKAVHERRTAAQWLRVDELRLGMRMHLHPHGALVAAPALAMAGGGLPDSADSAALPTRPFEVDIVSIEPVGMQDVYDIQTESGEFLAGNVAVHNCFILSVEDSMDSILDWNTKEGNIFRGGSGSGINLSNIRGSMEPLAKGGTASGPVSFMRGADSWAGTIKSGGKTRRAAKMVVLDVDHPDIREFIWCKAKEEDKARALAAAGFDMSLDGDGMKSIQYQNANNSVRLTDEFLQAVQNDDEWRLLARTTGEPVGDPISARELMHEIAEAAWRCADPGVQYDTTINQWHTDPNSGRINASNPCCFVADTPIGTVDGSVRIAALAALAQAGDELPSVECVDVDSGEAIVAPITNAWSSGLTTELSTVTLETGLRIQCTPEHRFLSAEGDWVEARFLEGRTISAIAVDGASDTAVLVRTVAKVATVWTRRLAEAVEVFDLEVEGHHNFVVGRDAESIGPVVHNSEYMHVDDSACNLASLNLMKFRRPDGTFDVPTFEHAVDIVFLAQEIIVGPSSYPTEKIGENARKFRQLGMGYANLGAYLMANGLPYDSDGGRATAAAITALMTGRGYLQSARVAAAIGPYDAYAANREAHNGVMRMHRDAALAIPDAATHDMALVTAARETWNEAVAEGELYGYRNAQASVLAPTGTISFLMDCDTTGVEPDFSLVKFKSLVGGGSMTIVNGTVPLALRELGYDEQAIEAIVAYIDANGTIIGAPGLKDEHLPVFDVAVGERAISHMGHIKMMGAVQPFISGAISKTINMPATATVDDVMDAYMQAWHLGIKALAIYRDGSKNIQVLNTDASKDSSTKDRQVVVAGASEEEVEARVAAAVAEAEQRVRDELAAVARKTEAEPKRRRMPRERQSITHKFFLGGHEGYITAGMYPDGTVGEIFLTDVGKEGSTLRGMMNSFATAISIALQYGVPLETLVEKFAYMRFDPEGITQNPEIPFAKSLPDYIMRWLASRFLDVDHQEELGILTPAVRARKSAQEADPANRMDTSGPSSTAPNGGSDAAAAGSVPAASAMTEKPPVRPAGMAKPDVAVGVICDQCGGIMQRTGSCYTCSSCGNNTGCG